MKKYAVVFEKSDTGYAAYVPDLPGCITTGKSLEETERMIREANHPNVRPMLDFFHFWSGMSKFEDLDMLQPGELAHVHFQDILDTPREIIDNNGRVIPGDGKAPIVAILKKLAEKQYNGALSVELFLMELTQGDPFEVGSRIKPGSEFRQTAGASGLRHSARRHTSLFFPLPPAGRHTLSRSRSDRPSPRR